MGNQQWSDLENLKGVWDRIVLKIIKIQVDIAYELTSIKVWGQIKSYSLFLNGDMLERVYVFLSGMIWFRWISTHILTLESWDRVYRI